MISTQYAAFISYRHQSPDQEIAKRLHRMIETYFVPTALRKDGNRRLGKVFRDQEELPLSSDLGKDIEDALENSEWLICICSPRYLESRWCRRELEYFIEHKGRDRVLTVLAEGEPQESFPEELLFETDDAGNRVEREPLAADVRGADLGGSLKKLKKEKFRILAPMAGTSFDGLYQRQRRRTMRNILAASLSAVAVLGAFLAYALVQNGKISAQNAQITAQNEQITVQNEQITAKNTELTEKNEQIEAQNARIEEERVTAARNECDLLIEKSVYYSSLNQKQEAARLGLEALAVSETIGGYGTGNIQEALAVACSMGDFAVEAQLDFPGFVNYDPSCVFSPDGTKLAVVDSRSGLSLCDAATGERLWVSSPFSHDITSVHWKEDSSLLVVTVRSGHTVCIVDAADGAHLNQAYIPWACNAVFDGDNVAVAFSQGMILWEPGVDDENFPWIYETEEDQYATSKALLNGRFISFCPDTTIKTPIIFIRGTGEEESFIMELESNKYVTGYTLSPDAEWIFIHQFDRCMVINLRTDEIRWTAELETGTFIPNEDCGPVWAGDVILDCGTAYDAVTGKELYRTENTEYVGVTPDGQYFADAEAFYRLSDGSWFADIPGTLKAIDPSGNHLVVYQTVEYGRGAPGNPDALVSRRQAAYLELSPGNGSQYTVDKYEGSILDIPDWTDPKVEGSMLGLYDPYGTSTTSYILSRSFISPDTRYCLTINLGMYIPIYDLEKGNEPAYRIYDFSVGDHVEAVDASFSADSRYAAIAGAAGHIAVYELETGAMVRSFTDTYLARSLSGLKFNRGGNYLMAADFNLHSFRVYSVTNGQTVYIMHAVKEVDSWGFDEETGDAVLKYTDGSALIARMFEDEEVLAAYARETMK